jgi:hypothetical protein
MSTTSYLISLLVPGDDLKFVMQSEGHFVLGGDFSQASSWPTIEEAKVVRDAFADSLREQGYRTALGGEALGDPEDPASKAAMFTILRSTLEPALTSVLIKD